MQERPRIRIDGYRYIKNSDTKYLIISGDSRVDWYSLNDYLQWDIEGSYVIVHIYNRRPIAVMRLIIEERYVLLDMLAIDHAHQKQGIGRNLVRLAERITCKLGKNIIKLEALDTSVGFYSRLGFKELPSRNDLEWGLLTPMEKQLIC